MRRILLLLVVMIILRGWSYSLLLSTCAYVANYEILKKLVFNSLFVGDY